MTDAVDQTVTSGLEQWPGVRLDAGAFAVWLGPKAVRLGELRGADLYLACGCALHDRAALAHFERALLSQLPQYTSRLGLSGAELEELAGVLREQLLTGRAPGIGEYSGTGPLGAWLRVAAIRAALKLKRGKKPTEAIDDAPALRATGADPELDALKREHRRELSAALTAVFDGLSRDERRVLKLHFLDGLSIDEIGVLYKVHRSTIARWIAAAREAVLKQTRARLATKLKLSGSECDSLIGVMRSQLDVSLRRALESRRA